MQSYKRNKSYFFWLLDPWFITWSKKICDFTKDFQCWVVGMKEEDHTLKLKIVNGISVQIVQVSSGTHHVQLFATPWTAARLASLSITNSWSLPKLMSIESVMPSNHLILCCPLLLPPSIFPSIKFFSNESVLMGFSFNEQVFFNFIAAVTICSDFGAQENKVSHCFHCFSIYLPWSDGTRYHDLSFLNAEF